MRRRRSASPEPPAVIHPGRHHSGGSLARRAFEEFSPPVRNLLEEFYRLRATGTDLDPEEVPAVGAARTLIADTLAGLPVVALDRGRPMATQPPLVVRPDPFELRPFTVHRMAMHWTSGRTGGGNVWAMPTARDGDGVPAAVTLLEPGQVEPIQDPTGRVIGCRWQGRELLIDTGAVVHVPWKITGHRGTLGDSAITEARQRFEDLAALFTFSGEYWRTFGAPSVVLKFPHRPDPSEISEARTRWTETHGGRRVPAVVGGGAAVEPFVQDAMGAELVAAEGAATAEVARAHLIPPSLLNATMAGASLTYTNTRDELRRWRLTGLAGFILRLETLFTELLSMGGQYPTITARVDTSEFLRLDERERAEVDQIDLASGVVTVDEARARRGVAPSIDGVSVRQ